MAEMRVLLAGLISLFDCRCVGGLYFREAAAPGIMIGLWEDEG
jgi:hypothetical protein